MNNSFVIMTAMPPTKGHLALIDFSSLMCSEMVTVIVCTQPSEPFATERFRSLDAACADWKNVKVEWFHKEIEQDSNAPGFWDMWRGILSSYGMTKDDTIVASEAYGQQVADLFGAKFMPYDPARELQPIKATQVREYPAADMDKIIPEFQKHIIKTVTLFGAESVGKTTLSKTLATVCNGHWRFEYARPYLEMVGAEVTDAKMYDIFNGQEAIQMQGRELVDKPFVIQDTDLYSTIGYWELWKGENAPADWYWRAKDLKSDLYIIPSCDIPFEPDALRYGGTGRESDDQYWIDLCEANDLNYVVVNSRERDIRVMDAVNAALHVSLQATRELRNYRRKHND